jgi:hypothetical protein
MRTQTTFPLGYDHLHPERGLRNQGVLSPSFDQTSHLGDLTSCPIKRCDSARINVLRSGERGWTLAFQHFSSSAT